MAKNKRPAPAPVEPAIEPIIVKIVQSVRPGDVIFIECDQARTTQQLTHLNEQIKAKLPDVRVVILNKGSRVASMQTLATIATTEKKEQVNGD